MAIVKKLILDGKWTGQMEFYCPGCSFSHAPNIIAGNGMPCWNYNGDEDKPTFQPSIRVRFGDNLCHSFVTNGRIQYLSDCTHNFANQTIDLPQIRD